MRLNHRAWLLVGACSSACASASDPGSALPAAAPRETLSLDPEARAAEAWTRRDDREAVELAIASWERALEEQQQHDADLLTSLSRAYFFLGDAHLTPAGESEAALEAFENGVAAGERALLAAVPELATHLQSGVPVDDVVHVIPTTAGAAIHWYAANLEYFARAKGTAAALLYDGRVRLMMQRLMELDETFFHAAPHRYFGSYYARATAFAGGDLERSRQHFERALELAPEHLGTRVLYAQTYASAQGDRVLFAGLLQETLALDSNVPEAMAPEQRAAQANARRLLAQIDDYVP